MAWEHKSQMTAPTVNWNKWCVAAKGLSYQRFLVRFGPETARFWLRAARDRFFGEWIDFSAYVIRGHWPVEEGLSPAKAHLGHPEAPVVII